MREQIKSVYKQIEGNSGLLLTIVPVIIYFIGYLKYYMLLAKLGIKMPVNDIFPLLSIFVSGITMLVSLLYVPTLALLFSCWITSHIRKKHQTHNLQIYLILLLLIISSIVPICFNRYLFIPRSIHWIFCLGIVLAMLYATFLSVKYRKLIWILSIIGWFLCIGCSYYKALPSIDESYYRTDINSEINLDSGVSGYMVTNFKLTPDSRYTDFYNLDGNNYQTYGILLSVHDGMSYFYTNDRIYIIPDGSILHFDQYLHETTYVDP